MGRGRPKKAAKKAVPKTTVVKQQEPFMAKEHIEILTKACSLSSDVRRKLCEVDTNDKLSNIQLAFTIGKIYTLADQLEDLLSSLDDKYNPVVDDDSSDDDEIDWDSFSEDENENS